MIAPPSSGLWVVLGGQSSPGPAYIHHVYKRPAAAAAIGGAASWSKSEGRVSSRDVVPRARVVTTFLGELWEKCRCSWEVELSQRLTDNDKGQSIQG